MNQLIRMAMRLIRRGNIRDPRTLIPLAILAAFALGPPLIDSLRSDDSPAAVEQQQSESDRTDDGDVTDGDFAGGDDASSGDGTDDGFGSDPSNDDTAAPDGDSSSNSDDSSAARSGLPTIAADDLPVEAIDTLLLIDAGGPFPFDRDDITFQNREGILPDESSDWYREYTVITPGESTRGARRIVAGLSDDLYWTDDHYASFSEIVDW